MTTDNKQEEVEGIRLVKSIVKLESIECKSRIKMFVRHTSLVDLKAILKPGCVLLVKNAQRKMTTILNIQV